MDSREWIIKGNEYNGHTHCTVDGPVPAVNEQITVIDKKLYEETCKAFVDLLEEVDDWDWEGCAGPRGGEIGWVKERHAKRMVETIREAYRVLHKPRP